ncbi:MAG: hypothetical protein EXR52_05910 [Dehalococcoidia bacterium]|nr:hypothetical protein [Dehalococcoidia bacterium]
MPIYTVSLHRRWFGEDLETKLADFDHEPVASELLVLAQENQLGGGATLHVKAPKGGGQNAQFRVRDLKAAAE